MQRFSSRSTLWLFTVMFLSFIVLGWLDPLEIFCVNEQAELTGMVDDCCCPVDTVDSQIDAIHTALAKLCKRTFFKYFKVNYLRDCPFWVAEYLCSMNEGGGCGVCECEEHEIPVAWKEEDRPIDATLNPKLTKWQDDDCDMWTHKDFNEGSYLNLELNPQRHTGFVGYEANRIWKMIYNENCFHGTDEDGQQLGPTCFEERVFYRLLSGFHASVSLAISESYRDPVTGSIGPNTTEFLRRFGDHPEWLKNVYFTFLFLLRAATHARPFLSNYDYVTGLTEDDVQTKQQMQEFLEIPLCNGCIPTFNESEMFTSANANELKQQLRAKFRNISEIMDCVACESCKVQAKLNVLGIGTALKILVADADKRPAIIQNLQRNEIIALINALRKYSAAIINIRKMERRILSQPQGINIVNRLFNGPMTWQRVAIIAAILFGSGMLGYAIFRKPAGGGSDGGKAQRSSGKDKAKGKTTNKKKMQKVE